LNNNEVYLDNIVKEIASLVVCTWVNRTFYQQLTPPLPSEITDDELELWLWKLRYYLQLSPPDNKTTPTRSWRWARKKLSTSNHYTIINDEDTGSLEAHSGNAFAMSSCNASQAGFAMRHRLVTEIVPPDHLLLDSAPNIGPLIP
jgi:hypothetical protein